MPSSLGTNIINELQGEGKDKKTITTKKGDETTPLCTHCKKDEHDKEHYWKLDLELRTKGLGGKGKQKTMATMQDLRSDSSDETLITVIGTKGTLSINDSSDLVASTSYLNEPVSHERKRNELFHIRVVIKNIKVETLFDLGSQANLISKSLVERLGLETKPHPSPYLLGWVRNKAKLQVTKQCRARFVIASK